jgi:hypothetical protein
VGQTSWLIFWYLLNVPKIYFSIKVVLSFFFNMFIQTEKKKIGNINVIFIGNDVYILDVRQLLGNLDHMLFVICTMFIYSIIVILRFRDDD